MASARGPYQGLFRDSTFSRCADSMAPLGIGDLDVACGCILARSLAICQVVKSDEKLDEAGYGHSSWCCFKASRSQGDSRDRGRGNAINRRLNWLLKYGDVDVVSIDHGTCRRKLPQQGIGLEIVVAMSDRRTVLFRHSWRALMRLAASATTMPEGRPHVIRHTSMKGNAAANSLSAIWLLPQLGLSKASQRRRRGPR